MPRWLRVLFLVDAIGSLILGILFLIIPGRFLGVFGWLPIDPIISRLLGAALLALGWGSFRGWQATDQKQARTIMEIQTVFTVLACAGLLRHLLFAYYPYYVWALFVIYLVLAVAWIVALVTWRPSRGEK